MLLWTLDRIRRSGACARPNVRHAVRTAHSRVQGVATPQSYSAGDCTGRTYNRLNDDYRVLHALCRFFLEHTGPTHESGSHHSLPFLVDMDRLFEMFVAEWLRQSLPSPLRVVAQKRVPLNAAHQVHFAIDLVLSEKRSGRVLAVLDTKYKGQEEGSVKPLSDDIAQVVAYAEAVGCKEAFLVYPTRLDSPLELQVGRIWVQTAAFDLGGNLEAAGRELVDSLLGRLETRRHLTAQSGAPLPPSPPPKSASPPPSPGGG